MSCRSARKRAAARGNGPTREHHRGQLSRRGPRLIGARRAALGISPASAIAPWRAIEIAPAAVASPPPRPTLVVARATRQSIIAAFLLRETSERAQIRPFFGPDPGTGMRPRLASGLGWALSLSLSGVLSLVSLPVRVPPRVGRLSSWPASRDASDPG